MSVEGSGVMKFSKGFSLIELMVAVAVIGILIKVAYPSYTDYVVQSRRTDAQRSMVEYMQALERYFTANGRYANSAGTACGISTAPSTPSMYSLSCAVVAGGGVTITATASSAQSTDGDLTLSSTGAKTPSNKWKF